MRIPWFFEHLGIAPTSDARTIKRAYAVALKAIDQQQEREAFETLRRAYERALAWGEHQAADGQDDEDDNDNDNDDEDADERDGWQADDDTGGHDLADTQGQRREKTGQDPGEGRSDTADAQTQASSRPPGSADDVVNQSVSPPLTDPQAALAAWHQQHQQAARTDQQAEAEAIRHWMALLLPDEGTIGPDAEASSALLLMQALNDPRLAHLDARTHLQSQLAEALYDSHEGQAGAFTAAVKQFGWAEGQAHRAASADAAGWISLVINQQLLLDSQRKSKQKEQQAALAAAVKHAPDDPAAVQQFVPTLKRLQDKAPDWLALQLPADRLAQWLCVPPALPAKPDANSWHAKGTRFTIWVFLVVMASSVVTRVLLKNGPENFADQGFSVGQTGDATSPDAGGAAGAFTGPPEPVLAYELTGTITAESCATAHEFAHASNWLDIDDRDAMSLFTSRILLCHQRKLWPQMDDPLIGCLRSAGLSALTGTSMEGSIVCKNVTGEKNSSK